MCFLKHYLLNFFSVGKNIKEERQKNDLRKKRKENPRKKAIMFCVSTSQKKILMRCVSLSNLLSFRI